MLKGKAKRENTLCDDNEAQRKNIHFKEADTDTTGRLLLLETAALKRISSSLVKEITRELTRDKVIGSQLRCLERSAGVGGSLERV